ncbi:MAG: TolC family protein [Balneola sp.]|nr:MAG: TolC family protein [Balneola sp.]
MKLVKSIILACLFALSASSLNAQVVEVDSIEYAIEYAIQNNPTLETYKLQAQITDLNYKLQKNTRFPTITYNFSGQNTTSLAVTPVPGELFGQPGETIETEFGQPFAFSSGITVQSDRLDWQNKLKTKLAENEVSILEAEVDEFKQQLVQQVSLYYYTALIAKKAIEINEENISVSDQIIDLAELRLQEGLEDQFGVNQSKMNASNTLKTKLSNEALYEECITQLKNLFGLPYSTELRLNEDLDYEWSHSVSSIDPVSNRRLVTLNRQIEGYELNFKVQRAAYYPSVTMTNYTGKQLNRDDFGLEIGKGTWADYNYTLVTISFPLFTGFNRSNNVKIANRQLSLAKLDYEIELRNTELSDMLLLSDYNQGVETLEQSQTTYDLAKENQDIAFVRYEEGLITLDQYLDAVEDRLQSENAYLNDLSILYSYYSTIISRTEQQ